ncbi:hypothetical protein [Streptomyces avermitilis]|uniref:hypothetical protein n=1 Tax=Streptomyces avermitilis TaxID=33903 RepID=UPI0037FBE8B4
MPALLPLVHAESALSEMGYFHGVTGSAADTARAYDRFVGHTLVRRRGRHSAAEPDTDAALETGACPVPERQQPADGGRSAGCPGAAVALWNV